MLLPLQSLPPMKSGENSDHSAHARIGSCLKVERSIADVHNFPYTRDSGCLHGAKYHVRSGTSRSNITARDVGSEQLGPARFL